MTLTVRNRGAARQATAEVGSTVTLASLEMPGSEQETDSSTGLPELITGHAFILVSNIWTGRRESDSEIMDAFVAVEPAGTRLRINIAGVGDCDGVEVVLLVIVTLLVPDCVED